MDSWILHALLVTGLVIHGSHTGDPHVDDEDYSGDNSGDNSNEMEPPDTTSVISLTTIFITSLQAAPPKHSPTPNLSPQGKSSTEDILGDDESYSMAWSIATGTSEKYGEVSGDGGTEHSKDLTESTDTTSVTSKVTSMTNLTSVLDVTTPSSMTSLTSVLDVTTPSSMTNLTSVLDVTTSMTNLTSVLDVTTTTSITNLTSVLTTSLEATPPKHSSTPNLSPQGKSHISQLLLALGIVLLLCTALLVSTIMLACQVWKLHDQFCSVFPAQPLRVNVDVIRAGKASEMMGIEIKKMMEEAKDMAEKTVGEEADAQETEVAVVPTAPPADPSSDCVLNV